MSYKRSLVNPGSDTAVESTPCGGGADPFPNASVALRPPNPPEASGATPTPSRRTMINPWYLVQDRGTGAYLKTGGYDWTLRKIHATRFSCYTSANIVATRIEREQGFPVDIYAVEV